MSQVWQPLLMGSDSGRNAETHEAESVARFNALPSMQAAAACVLRNPLGQVLIVDLAYQPHWELPGGAVEDGESPLAACIREVAEEIGLVVAPEKLLCVDHQSMRQPRRHALRFLFDGGVIAADQHEQIVLGEGEIDGFAFVDLSEVDRYLSPRVSRRLRRGIESPGCYLEDGDPIG